MFNLLLWAFSFLIVSDELQVDPTVPLCYYPVDQGGYDVGSSGKILTLKKRSDGPKNPFGDDISPIYFSTSMLGSTLNVKIGPTNRWIFENDQLLFENFAKWHIELKYDLKIWDSDTNSERKVSINWRSLLWNGFIYAFLLPHQEKVNWNDHLGHIYWYSVSSSVCH